MHANERVNDIANVANFSYNGAAEGKFGSFDSGDDGEHNAVGLVEMLEIYAVQSSCF